MLLAMVGWQEWTAAGIVAAIVATVVWVNTGANRNSARAGDLIQCPPPNSAPVRSAAPGRLFSKSLCRSGRPFRRRSRRPDRRLSGTEWRGGDVEFGRFVGSAPAGVGQESCSSMASRPRCVIRYWTDCRLVGRPTK
jgi:hypothetical protein